MPQTERLQIITGISAPQSTAHLGRYSNLIAEVPFPLKIYNHSTSPYAHPEDFVSTTDYNVYLMNIHLSIRADDSINIPEHFTKFFSYIEFY